LILRATPRTTILQGTHPVFVNDVIPRTNTLALETFAPVKQGGNVRHHSLQIADGEVSA
jgi:hypothetical protein